MPMMTRTMKNLKQSDCAGYRGCNFCWHHEILIDTQIELRRRPRLRRPRHNYTAVAMSSFWTILFTALALAVTASTVVRVSATIITIQAQADATIREDEPQINYGSSDFVEFIAPPSMLASAGNNVGTRIEGLLRFDIGPLLSSDVYSGQAGGDVSSDAIVNKATLKLFTNQKCDFSGEEPLSTGHLGDFVTSYVHSSTIWAETLVTWESFAGTNSEDLVDEEGIKTPFETFTPNNWIIVDVTSLVHKGHGNKFFSLRLSSSGYRGTNDNIALCHFYSIDWMDGQFGPQLVLDYSMPSSPSVVSSSSVVSPSSSLATTAYSLAANSVESSTHDTFDHEKTSATSDNTAAVIVVNANCATPYTDYPSGYQFKSGDIVSNEGKNFQCNPYPFTEWCSSESYAPGVSRNWGLAWEVSLVLG